MKSLAMQDPKKKSLSRLFLKVFGIIVTVVLIGSISLLTFAPEARNMLLVKFFPVYARNANFVKLTKNDQEIYLLGTIHSNHLTTKDYSLRHLKAVITNLKPDLVLVESRPEELQKDNWGDGPIEMPFASLTAKSLGMKVDGMDWWDSSNIGSLISDNGERDNRMAQNVLDRVTGHRKVLVLTGYSHVSELVSRLKKQGYSEASFTNQEKDSLFITADIDSEFPPYFAFYIQKRIDIDRASMEKETNPRAKAAYKNAIDTREKFLKDFKAGKITTDG
jgi:hypothetical protein